MTLQFYDSSLYTLKKSPKFADILLSSAGNYIHKDFKAEHNKPHSQMSILKSLLNSLYPVSSYGENTY